MIFSKYILILSIIIINVHSIIPHEHEVKNDLQVVSEENNIDFLEFLYTVINSDIGNNHLNNFNLSDIFQFENEFECSILLIEFKEDLIKKVYSYHQKYPPDKEQLTKLLTHKSNRAPPKNS